nr:hypothetical protein [uncultured archaeon]
MIPNTTPLPPQGESKLGPIIGIIIVVIVLIIGALYFWGEKLNKANDLPQGDTMVNNLKSQQNSDEVSSIEADLKATNLDDIDADLKAEAASSVQ